MSLFARKHNNYFLENYQFILSATWQVFVVATFNFAILIITKYIIQECLYLLQNSNDSPRQHCSNYFLQNYQFILSATWQVFVVATIVSVREVDDHETRKIV